MGQRNDQKRGASRFAAGIPAVLHWNGEDFDCKAEDLSRSGARLVGNLPENAGPSIEVSVASPARDLKVRLAARVRRTSRAPEGNTVQLGVEFWNIAFDARDVLERLVSRVIEGVVPAALESLPPKATRQQIRDALESVPVTHRAVLASRGTPREREILIQDNDPQVLDALTRNHGLTPPELRTLLRARQLLPRTLEHLARDTRWTASEELKVAIACHPNTPFPVADQLIKTLTPDGRRRALTQPGLNPILRTQLAIKR